MKSRSLIAIWLSALLFAGASMTAQGGPSPSLCTVDSSRGLVPESFPIEACIGADEVRVRNDLAVPVEIATTGGVGALSVTRIDQDLAALATRAIIDNDNVLLPGDIAFVPVSAAGGTLLLASISGADVYIEAKTLSAFLPLGVGADAVDGLADLVTDVADAAFTASACRDGANWVEQQACDLAYNASVVVVIGAAIGSGVLSLTPVGPVVAALEWGQLVYQQVPSVTKVATGDRVLTISSRDETPGESITGTWSGAVTQPGSRPYSIKVTFDAGSDPLVGQVDYPGLECGGSWTLETSTGDTYVFKELITRGSGCVEEVDIHIRAVSSDELAYEVGAPYLSTATLTRDENSPPGTADGNADWPVDTNDAPPALMAWFGAASAAGASSVGFPNWVSCIDSGDVCIAGGASTVGVIEHRESGFYETHSIPITQPARQSLLDIGLSQDVVSELLAAN